MLLQKWFPPIVVHGGSGLQQEQGGGSYCSCLCSLNWQPVPKNSTGGNGNFFCTTWLLSGSFHFSLFVFWSNVRFIPFSVFHFLVKVTKNEKNQLSCLFIFCIKNPAFAWNWQLIFCFLVNLTKKLKMLITENKQTGQLIFLFWVTLTKNEKWNECPSIKNCHFSYLKMFQMK